MDQDFVAELPVDGAERTVFWTQHIHAWQRSGLSQAAYAQQHQLPLARFSYWKRKLEPTQGSFVRVNVATAVASPVRIHHRSGTLIECLPGTDIHWLRDLLGMNDAS